MKDELSGSQAASSAVGALTEDIVGCWRELLGREVDAASDFFAAGGSSLVMLAFAAHVRQRYRSVLPLERFLADPTPRGVGGWLSSAMGLLPRPAPLITLHSGADPASDAVALFAVPGASGNPTKLLILAGADLGRPLVGIQTTGLVDEAGAPLSELPDMARQLADRIVAAQPRGPYLIAAWCAGFSLGLETARRLACSGRPVATVIGLGASPPTGATATWPRHRVELLALESARGALGLMPAVPAVADAYAATAAELRAAGRFTPDEHGAWLRSWAGAWATNVQAADRWTPRPYPGRVVFVDEVSEALPATTETVDGWRPYLAVEPVHHQLPTAVDGLLTDPALGAVLRQELSLADP